MQQQIIFGDRDKIEDDSTLINKGVDWRPKDQTAFGSKEKRKKINQIILVGS